MLRLLSLPVMLGMTVALTAGAAWADPTSGSTIVASPTSNLHAPTMSKAPAALNFQQPITRTGLAPLKGHNSFTQAQAQTRIVAAGYTQVSPLKKNNMGIWVGMATSAGKQVPVGMDYQGNVVRMPDRPAPAPKS